MNKKGVLTLWGIAVLTLLCAAGLILIKKSSISNFSCQGDAVATGRDAIMTSSIKFSFIDGNGRYESNSTFVQPGINDRTFSNTIYFKYWREGDEVIMISDNNNARSEALKPFLEIPDFFLYRERGIAVKILKVNHNSFVFTHDGTPIFYCKSTI